MHRYPSQYDDNFDALKYLDENNFDLRERVSKTLNAKVALHACFIAGDSAGGNIAHHVAVRASEYKFKVVKVVGLIGIQPLFGGEERTESEMTLTRVPLISVDKTDTMWKSFLPEGFDRDHAAVNVFGPNGEDISRLNFLATIVFVGEFDPLQDWQRRYYKGLKRAGKEVELIEYSNAIHGFFGVQLPETALLMKDIGSFMKKQGTYA